MSGKGGKGLEVSRYQGVKVSGCQGIRVSGYQGVEVLGCQVAGEGKQTEENSFIFHFAFIVFSFITIFPFFEKIFQ